MYVREGIIMKSHITCYINNPDFHRTADGNSNSCLFTEHGEKKTDMKKCCGVHGFSNRIDKRTYPRFDHANI